MTDEGTKFSGGITDEDDCPYLPGRRWRNLVLDVGEEMQPALHEYFLDHGFRRMGRYMYRPACEGCSECRSLRVDVRAQKPSKNQRRVLRRNADVDVSVAPALYDEEKRALLERFLAARHEGPMSADEESMQRYMFDSPGETMGLSYRLDDRLVGYGLLDLTVNVGSSLYFFFDPDESDRSLGIFSMLWEVQWLKSSGRRYYHPGFYVADCSAMNYKRRIGPLEILEDDGGWKTFDLERHG